MKDAFERFFNSQSDADWTWGPLLSWRPPKTGRFTGTLFCRLFLLPMLIGFLLPFLMLGGNWAIDRVVVYSPGTWFAWLADNSLGIGQDLAAAFVPLFLVGLLLGWFYAWAWNRRADRLSPLSPEAADILMEQPADPREGVWPPPPTAPLPAQKGQ